jgi:hypothetical protein
MLAVVEYGDPDDNNELVIAGVTTGDIKLVDE